MAVVCFDRKEKSHGARSYFPTWWWWWWWWWYDCEWWDSSQRVHDRHHSHHLSWQIIESRDAVVESTKATEH